MRCAVCQIDDGMVINVIIANPSDIPPDNCKLVLLGADEACASGWRFNGSEFEPPADYLAEISEAPPAEMSDDA